jgi:hypothetical protein
VKKNSLYIALFITIGLISCAKVAMPSGGPKDITPPVVVKCVPENGTLGFTGKKITITFDEFIQLKEADKQLVISPPMQKAPELLLKGKSLIITIGDTLLQNTTYNLNFGDAITDNNEGNILRNYEYSFATGESIDSLSLKGNVVSAFDLKPDKDRLYAMLYRNLSDSAPLKKMPAYVSRSDDKGNFTINRISPGKYRLIALKDENSNLKFDPPKELIAFSDTLLKIEGSAFVLKKPKPDTLLKDTAHLSKDSLKAKLKADTLFHPQVRIFSFQEKDKALYMTGNSRKIRQRLAFFFNNTIKDSLRLIPMNFKANKAWYEKEKTVSGDTIYYWMTDTTVFAIDTMRLKVQYQATDSLFHYITKTDTLQLDFLKVELGKKAKKKLESKVEKEIEIKSPLELKSNIQGTIDLNKLYALESTFPISSLNVKKIRLTARIDTIEKDQPFQFERDTFFLRKYVLHTKWIPNVQYKLVMDKGAFIDIYGNKNDSSVMKFSTQKEEFYGSLTLKMKNVMQPMILQLLTEKGGVVSEVLAYQDGNYKFGFLAPMKYTVKVIFDTNRNGIWDTGDYLRKVKPEKVLLYPEAVNVRSNWDLNLNWELKLDTDNK